LEEICCAPVLDDLGVFLNRVHSKIEKFLFVGEEDGSGGLLVVTAVAGVEDLYPKFSLLVGLFGRDGEAVCGGRYPEAPVPKSMAMTCVNSLSSFSKAIQILTYYISLPCTSTPRAA